MNRIHDPFGHHDWSSKDYVRRWAERQDKGNKERRQQFQLMADLIPFDRDTPIAFLELGAGYGALSKFLLELFPRARAVCHDGSEEMAKLGRERMVGLKKRFKYVVSDFGQQGWSKVVRGQFDCVVSSNAIHNVRTPDTVRDIYREAFPLVRPGGCFFNLDKIRAYDAKQIEWLKGAGFKDAACYWKGARMAIFGGFK